MSTRELARKIEEREVKMLRYVLKRLALMVPILLIVTLIVFVIANLMPGDIARTMLGGDAPQSAVDQLRHEMHLDQPLLNRFVTYVANMLKGDFGTSYRSKMAVLPQVMQRFPVSLKLSLCAITFAAIVGIRLGVIVAIKQYSILDNICTVIALFFAAIPPFWFGLMLIFFFSLKLGWFPTNGLNTAANYVLPTLTMGIPTAAVVMRLTRSSMLETTRADYVRTARSKGLTEPQVIVQHALKNALLPIITQVGMSFGIMFGNCAMTESVFVIPGCGLLILNAVKSKDVPLLMGSILVLSFTFCAIMLIVDLLYAF